jgi:DNA-directed RNA polymerase subunit F
LYRNYLASQNKVSSNYISDENGVSEKLDAALAHLENAEKWSGKKFTKADHEIISEGKSLSKRTKTGFQKDEETLKKDWSTFLKKLKTLDDKLEG